jgi:KipI family sensor histidine kinase inhibitor
MRVRPVGPMAVLFEVDALSQAEELYGELKGRQDRGELPYVQEIVPAARTVLVIAGTSPSRLHTLCRDLRSWVPDGSARAAGPLHELPVRYDGEDLAFVARQAGLSEHEVIEKHSNAEFRVAFCGFSPGFAYLTGVPPSLQMPRRSTPRSSVPAGAVGLAGEFTAVYPRPSPGGWQIVGSTTVKMWDARRDPPALLAPGDRVRFVP